MVRVVKHEWHQVDSQFIADIDEDILSKIYPDLGPGEISHMLENIKQGILDVEDVIRDSHENNIDIEWERDYDDWVTDRKGGYEVTYELGK